MLQPLRARASALHLPLGTVTRFGIVGLFKAVLDFGTFNLVLLVTASDDRAVVLLANTLGFTVAMAVTFVLNERFTFRSRARRRGIWRYVAISLAGVVIYNATLALVLVLTDGEGLLVLNAAKAASLVTSAAWNFLGYRYLVFGPHVRPPEDDAPARERAEAPGR